MIFKRAIFSELTSTAGAVFTVLFSIIFSVGLVRILGDAAGGRVDNAAVFQLVALAALTNLPTVLTLTLFVSVLIALSRSFRDSEMVVWFSSGQSLLAWIGPVLRFATPIVVLIALLTIGVSPWAERQIAESAPHRHDLNTRAAMLHVAGDAHPFWGASPPPHRPAWPRTEPANESTPNFVTWNPALLTC